MHVSTPAESDQTLLPVLRGAVMKRGDGSGFKERGHWQGVSRGASQETSPYFIFYFCGFGLVFFLYLPILIGRTGTRQQRPTCMTMRRSKTRMKEARKALETSSLGRKPRFRLSQLIQSVLMTSSTTDVSEMSTVLWGGQRGRWVRQ